jgi:SAM-dependent methyltransferase
LDVGCGNGQLMRELEGLGAAAFGLETDEAPIAAAAAAGTPRERLKLGVAQDLPFEDRSFDGVTFVFSFHHIPGAGHGQALSEAVRVPRGGGFVAAIDPLPFGSLTEVLQPLEDEFEVRTRAMRGPAGLRLRGSASRASPTTRSPASSPTCRDSSRGPSRSIRVGRKRPADPAVRREVSERFHRIAKRQGEGYGAPATC